MARAIVVGACLCFALSAFASADAPPRGAAKKEAATDDRLAGYLKRFPEADANGDGVLTFDEASAHREQVKNKKGAKAKKGAGKTVTPAGEATSSPSANRSPRAPDAVPTEENVAYGPHERNVLDFFRAEADKPTPVVIFFHGGGFIGGDKQSFRDRVPQYLAAGVSAVSANYRYSTQAIYPGPQLDGARAVQFVRSKAREWNIDPDRVVLSGSSAGAHMGLYLALHDDMADPKSSDPVARQSTRASAFVGYVTASSVEPAFVEQHFHTSQFGAVLKLFGVSKVEELTSAAKRDLVKDASPINHLTGDDPPLLLIYSSSLEPPPANSNFGTWIHHAHHGAILKAECEKLGIACRVYHAGDKAPAAAESAFVARLFADKDKNKAASTSSSDAAGEDGRPTSVVYKHNDDRDVRMTFDYPPGWNKTDRRPALIFFYNGGWNPGAASLGQFRDQSEYFARRGLVVANADYREKSPEGVTSTRCIEDTFSAIRYLRAHADELGIDAARIAAAGGSGSMHLAAASLYLETIHAEGEDTSISPWPGALFLFHPDVDVINPEVLSRLFDGSALREAEGKLPPTLVLYGQRDPLAGYLDDLVARAKKAGLPIDNFVGKNGLHGFYKFSPGLEESTKRVDDVLVSLGYLPAKSTVALPTQAMPEGYAERVTAQQAKWVEHHAQLAAARAKRATGANQGAAATDADDPSPPDYFATQGRKAGAKRGGAVDMNAVAIRQQTFDYRRAGDRRLVLVVHYPHGWQASDKRPVALFFEGGANNPKDKEGNFYPLEAELAARGIVAESQGPGEGFAPLADYLARRGMVTVRVEYRKRKTDGVMPDGAVADGAAAVRWVRDHASELGIDPQRVVAGGSSGGGHISASLFALDHLTSDAGGSTTSARPDALLLFSPMIDFIDEGSMGPRFLEAVNGDRQLAERLSPARYWRREMPPTLVFEGSREPVYKTVVAFVDKWKAQGAPIELYVGEGGGHGFAGQSPYLEPTTERADAFLQSIGYLAAEPKVELPTRSREERKSKK